VEGERAFPEGGRNSIKERRFFSKRGFDAGRHDPRGSFGEEEERDKPSFVGGGKGISRRRGKAPPLREKGKRKPSAYDQEEKRGVLANT